MRLTVEQEKIAYSKSNGYSLIKGIAGSGKTTVGLHRVIHLANNFLTEESDRILFVTYNRTLVNYINDSFNKIQKESKQLVFYDLKSKIDFKTVDQLTHSYAKNTYFKDYEITTNNHYQILSKLITKLKKSYPSVEQLDLNNKNFLLDEIKWIWSCNYLDEAEYQVADRTGRSSKVEGNGLSRLKKNSDIRKAIFELKTLYSQELKELEMVTFPELNSFALKAIRENPLGKYKHIIIDEAQDLSRVQLLFLKELKSKKEDSSILFLSDTAQSIYSQSWLGPGRPFNTLEIEIKGKSKKLNKNFRTTTEISKCAFSLIENSPEIYHNKEFVKPTLVDRHGDKPIYRHFNTIENEVSYYLNLLETNLKDTPRKDIAFICRDKITMRELRDQLKKKKVPLEIIDKNSDDFSEDSIKLLNMHSAKGLEFKVVFLPCLNSSVIPYLNSPIHKEEEKLQERKLLYVAMTRATETLYLSSSGEPSEFIKDISHLAKEKFSFYNVSIDDYYFKNRLLHPHSQEEKVRQWFLKELHTKYNYPLDLIDIEYPINFGSKKYYADIVVFKYENAKKIPYFFVETKNRHLELNEHHYSQLKSYLNMKNIDFGYLSNGDETISYPPNKEIPSFDNFLSPYTLSKFRYIDLNSSKSIEYSGNLGDISSFKGANKNFEFTSTTEYREISTTLTSNKEGNLILPKKSINENVKVFKINSDSMKPAFEKGDRVLIEKTKEITPKSVMAVWYNNSGSLKEVTVTGDIFILGSFNSEYEPLLVPKSEVEIIGRAKAVIKKIA